MQAGRTRPGPEHRESDDQGGGLKQLGRRQDRVEVPGRGGRDAERSETLLRRETATGPGPFQGRGAARPLGLDPEAP